MSTPAPLDHPSPSTRRTGVRASLPQMYACVAAVATTVVTSTAVVIHYGA